MAHHNKLRALWWQVRSSLWFVPGLLVLGATLLAVLLVEIDAQTSFELAQRWPRLFGSSADAAREMLSAIAASMITVAGVVFSVTIVSLSLASRQYSPRVLRSFMADGPTQAVLGVFVGLFAYCLVVLRTVRGGEEDFVPAIAVLAAIVLAFVAIGFLVFFIHHLAASIQASSILARVRLGTLDAVHELFPENLGEEADEASAQEDLAGDAWTEVPARESGYIVSLDTEGLLAFGRKEGRVVRMEVGVGDFVIEGLPLASLQGREAVPERAQAALRDCYSIERQRTIEQDAAYGIQQIVDIGVKAMSPGVSDPATAILAVDRLTEVLVALARRRIERRLRRDDQGLRVIAVGPTFAGLVELAYAGLRRHSGGEQPLLTRLTWSLEQLAASTTNAYRRAILATQAERLAECAQRDIVPEHEREQVLARIARLKGALTPAGPRAVLRSRP